MHKCIGVLHVQRMSCTDGVCLPVLPHSVCDPAALFPAVGGQAADEVGGVESAAEDAAHRAEQQELAVVGRCVAQGATHLLHYLWGRGRHTQLEQGGSLVCGGALAFPITTDALLYHRKTAREIRDKMGLPFMWKSG